MKRMFGWCVVVLALASLVGSAAEDNSLAALKDRRSVLAAERKDTEAKLHKRRQVLENSREMAAANSDIEKAAKVLDKALADDPGLKAARAAAAEARKNLDLKIAGAAEGSDDSKALDNQRDELEAKCADYRYQLRLLDIQLNHASSPARIDADADSAVKKARQANDELDGDIREKPTAAVAAAAKELAALGKAEGDLWKKLAEDSRELKQAAQEESASHEALRKAQSSDKRQEALAAARKALEEARAAALKANSAAKPILADIAKIEKEIDIVEADKRAAGEMMSMLRDSISAGNDRAISKARDALAAASKACEAAYTDEIRALGAARKAAYDAYDAKRQIADKAKEGNELFVKRAAAQKEIDQLKEKLVAGKSVQKEMLAAIKARTEIDQKLREQDKGAKVDEALAEEIKKLYRAFQGAKALHIQAIQALPVTKKAYDAETAAKKEFAAAVDARLASSDESQQVRALFDDLAALRRGQDYRLAVLRFKIYDHSSPVAHAVAQHPDVVAATAKVAALEQEIREKPLASVVDAEKAFAAARAKREEIEKKLRLDADYAKTVQARQAAEKALADARAADPRIKALSAASAALNKLVAEKTLQTAVGAPMAANIEKLTAELANAEKAIRGVAEKKVELRRAVERGENPAVAIAKKAVADADAAIRVAEQSEKIMALRKAVEDARAAREVRLKEVMAKDKEYADLNDELLVAAKVDQDLAEQMRAAEKAAKTAAAPAAPAK